MVFRRRDRLPLGERIRKSVLPGRGWRRSLEYIGHRVRRLPDTPHRIALGFCCGVFMSFTPLFGLHLFGAMGLAWLIGGNVLAAAIGQFAGNPLTLPFIAWVAMAIGRRVLGQGGPSGRSFERIDQAFAGALDGLWQTVLSWFGMGVSQWSKVLIVYSDVLLPYLVGGLLPGIITSIACYYLVRPLIAAYQRRRRARMLARARERLAQVAARAYKPGDSGGEG
jgi:uncharacterized protein (DUF2062 family)